MLGLKLYSSRKNSLPEALIQAKKAYGEEAIRIIVSDTVVFSNGQLADVRTLYRLAEESNSLLFLDEAHAIGSLGPNGAGVAVKQLPREFFRNNKNAHHELWRLF